MEKDNKMCFLKWSHRDMPDTNTHRRTHTHRIVGLGVKLQKFEHNQMMMHDAEVWTHPCFLSSVCCESYISGNLNNHSHCSNLYIILLKRRRVNCYIDKILTIQNQHLFIIAVCRLHERLGVPLCLSKEGWSKSPHISLFIFDVSLN